MTTLDWLAVGILTLAPWLGFLAAAELTNMRDRRRRARRRASRRRLYLGLPPPASPPAPLTPWHEDPILSVGGRERGGLR